MPYGVPPKNTTWCSTCEKEVGAVNDAYTRHRDPRAFTPVWRTSPHKHEGRPCPGSRLSVPDATVFTTQEAAS